MLKSLFSRLWHSTTFRLILIAFVVYNINLRSVTSLDTYPTRFLPISIINEFNLDLDEFPFMHKRPAWAGEADLPGYYVTFTRNHYVSSYPVMPAILSTPIYALPVWLGLTDGSTTANGYNQTEIVGTFLSKISASLAVAFSVGLMYLSLLRLTTQRGALSIALIYAFATSSWSVSSQGLWQTSMSQPLIALALYFLLKGKEARNNIVYAGIPLALAVACRPPVAIFAVLYFVYVALHHRDLLIRFMIFPLIIGALLITYNMYYFDSLVGGYTYADTEGYFTFPRLENLLGLLFSPSRGMLTLSPVLFFSVAGMGLALYYRRNTILVYTAIASILMVVFYSMWHLWDGAFSYSYRFLVDLLPGLCLFIAVVWEWIVRNWIWKSLLVVALTFSLLIQVTGAFFYPCGWYNTPVKVLEHRERFWDWRDPEFARCLANGPVDPDGLRFLRKVLGFQSSP